MMSHASKEVLQVNIDHDCVVAHDCFRNPRNRLVKIRGFNEGNFTE
jgi:hypothetical protein